MEETPVAKRHKSQTVLITVTDWVQKMQQVTFCAVKVVLGLAAVSPTISKEQEQDSLLLLYFKTMEWIEEAEFQADMHPGRGHQRFEIRAENNPLPKMNFCRFYTMLPDKFQLLRGYKVDEFDELLQVVSPQMLLPRNGYCLFDDVEQAMRQPRVSSYDCLSCPLFN
jgi:hypothetical protein